MWKKIRILILLLIFMVVGINVWKDYHPNWEQPMIVLLHPINADGQNRTEEYIQNLNSRDFIDAQNYIRDMSARYRQQPVTVYFQLGRKLYTTPPRVPENASVTATIWWSLKFRYYALQQAKNVDGSPSVTLYLNYYDPQKKNQLKHSTALQNGRIGSIHLFATQDQSEQNEIILVHELMHAFGASDKYDLVTGLPKFPVGFGNPDQKPLYPQTKAEIMGGHIAISETKSVMPNFLKQTVINAKTAQELGWIEAD